MFAFSDRSSICWPPVPSSLSDRSTQMFVLAQKQAWEHMFRCRERIGLLPSAAVTADVG